MKRDNPKISFLTIEKRMIMLCDTRFEGYRKTIEQLVLQIVQTIESKQPNSELMAEGFRMELKRVAKAMRADMYAIYYTNEYQDKGVF